jgi:hypothetical protein
LAFVIGFFFFGLDLCPKCEESKILFSSVAVLAQDHSYVNHVSTELGVEMGYSTDKMKQMLLLRKHVRAILDIPRGAGKDVEQGVMACCGGLAKHCAAADSATLEFGLPPWATKEVIKQVFKGEPIPELAAPPVEAAEAAEAVEAVEAVAGPKKVGSRACDIYLSRHREVLQAEVKARGIKQKSANFRSSWRKLGVKQFSVLTQRERLPYIAALSDRAKRVRDSGGKYQRVDADDCDDDAVLPPRARRLSSKQNVRGIIIGRVKQVLKDDTSGLGDHLRRSIVAAAIDAGCSPSQFRKVLPVGTRIWKGVKKDLV